MQFEKVFIQLAKLIASSLRAEEILKAIMEEIEKVFNPDNWSLFRLDSTSQELFFVIAKGIDKKAIKGLRFKLGEGIVGTVAKTREILIIEDVNANPNFSSKVDRLTGFQTQSIVAVPIVFHDEVMGVIELVNVPNAEKFSKHELLVLQVIADFSGIAFNNASIYENTLYRTYTDPLTGAYNRIKLDELIKQSKPKALARIYEQVPYLCVGMVDLDNFKAVNDKHGHAKGDEVLKGTVQTLKNYLRESDYIFRIGGDEFVIIIDKLAKVDSRKAQKNLSENLLLAKQEIKPFSFSYGLAVGEMNNLEHLIKEADQNMYDQKKNQKTRN